MWSSLDERSIELIQEEYRRATRPWYLGYSGGKDSSALLKLLFHALLELDHPEKPVTVLYCDTGVEIPTVRGLVMQTLEGIRDEAKARSLPLEVQVVLPKVPERYFVRLIGRGYAPPSNKFRWCTDRLRIRPVKRIIESTPGGEAVILLGLRRGESMARDRTITKHESGLDYYLRQTGNNGAHTFSPMLDYAAEDVWSTLASDPVPRSIDASRLSGLYLDTNGECPIIRDPRGTPCGKGRFGCWTCTVVRKDQAVSALVRRGHDELAPLLGFRNWLMGIRDDPELRCGRRRNGMPGLGPFTLSTRAAILYRLLEAQARSGLRLIAEEEITAIGELWQQDRCSASYSET